MQALFSVMTDPHETDEPNDPSIEDLDQGLEETNQFRPGMETDSLAVSGFLDETTNPEADEVVLESDAIHLEPGDQLGKYRIKKMLGQGGMGAVYLGYDEMIQREVAIKVLSQSANNSAAFERFLAEARATGKLNHPNVVAIYDIDTQGDASYIVMELVRGGSGTDYIEKRNEIDWKESVKIAAQAADGLAAAHRAELVHRDIKPENLMLTEEGMAKVVDFGLSKLIDSAADQNLNLTNDGVVLGTPRYMSPEQFDSNAVVDSRSDVYCLGGTLFSLLTGQYPFPDANNMIGIMKAHLSSPPPDPLEYNEDLPPEVREIVAKSMAKNPDERYQNAGELAESLWALIDSRVSSDALGLPSRIKEEYRPCQTALIVEPSKMQAMMMAKQLQQAGAENVNIVDTASAAMSRCESDPPSLLITALQLADGDGIALMQDVIQRSRVDQSTLVLNTSNIENNLLLPLDHTSTLAAVSKKTKPASLVKSLVACTYFELGLAASGSKFDAMEFRLGIVSDTTRIPETLEALIRSSNILDLSMATFDQLAAGSSSMAGRDLVIALRSAGETKEDNLVYSELMDRIPGECKNRIAIQVVEDELKVRSFRMEDFMALTLMPLDLKRWSRILDSCSS